MVRRRTHRSVGAVCLIGAIRARAGRGGDLAADAASILLDAVRRKLSHESVPAFNDRQHSSAIPARMLLEAADLVNARGR